MFVFGFALLAVNSFSAPQASPFAAGPITSSPKMIEAIAKCHAPAKVEEANGEAIVILDARHSEKASRCLSAWIFNHPEAGFQKSGFVGSEQP